MNIYILRHGEAEIRAESDRHRQLTPNGRSQLETLARRLLSLSISFDQVAISPYVRTQQTAEIVLKTFFDVQTHTSDLITPDQNPTDALALLEELFAKALLLKHKGQEQKQELQLVASVLLVSHQPMVSRLLELLVNGNTNSVMSSFPAFYPGSLAYLSTDTLAPGCCNFHWLKSAPDFL